MTKRIYEDELVIKATSDDKNDVCYTVVSADCLDALLAPTEWDEGEVDEIISDCQAGLNGYAKTLEFVFVADSEYNYLIGTVIDVAELRKKVGA